MIILRRYRRFVLLAATFAAALVATVATAATVDPASSPLTTLEQTDMTNGHEQIPGGVPSNYSWYAAPVITNANDANNYYAGNPWGQVYETATGNSPLGPNGEKLFVDIRNLNAWLLTKENAWVPLYKNADGTQRTAKLGGALYPEDFQGGSIAGNVTKNADGSETVAPKPASEAPVTAKGYLFHFYPAEARAGIPGGTVNRTPVDVAAVCSAAEVRLDPGNVATPYTPGLVANVGFDWWPYFSGGAANGAGEGRFKTVTHDWRVLTFCTMTADQRATAPPLPLSVDPGELY